MHTCIHAYMHTCIHAKTVYMLSDKQGDILRLPGIKCLGCCTNPVTRGSDLPGIDTMEYGVCIQTSLIRRRPFSRNVPDWGGCWINELCSHIYAYMCITSMTQSCPVLYVSTVYVPHMHTWYVHCAGTCGECRDCRIE